jgi:hypothetical protein
MRLLPATAVFYCGVDLRARTLYWCVIGRAGAVHLRHNLPADPGAFLGLRLQSPAALGARPTRSTARRTHWTACVLELST